MDTRVTIADVTFQGRVLNAGGTVKTHEELQRVLLLPDGSPSKVGGVVFGSIVKPKRSGNPGVVYWSNAKTSRLGEIDSYNSVGLSGGGWEEEYKNTLPLMSDCVHNYGLPAIVNNAGFDPEECIFLVERTFDAGADMVIQNWSCGNTGGDILAFEESFYRPALVGSIRVVPHGKKMFFKMPYFPSRGMLKRMADFLNQFDEAGGVIAINTLANALPLHPVTGEPYITPFDGLAGLGGAAIRDLALGQCTMWRDYLRKDMAVIGVGGIQTRENADLFLKHVGVDLIGVHTAYRESDSSIFGKLEGTVAT